MSSIIVNGLKTRYYAAGDGTKHVLLIHGWASSGRMWLRAMWALRRQYRLWALDLPGCGDSESPAIDWYSLAGYTDHVAAFCRALGIRPYGVIGHSMGARIAFDLARHNPTLVEKLVAVSPTITGRLGFNLHLVLVGGLFGSALNLLRRLWPIATAGAMSEYWAPRYLGSEAVKRTAEDLERTGWEAAVGSLRMLVGQDYSPYLAEIPHPTLLICGERDTTIPPDDSRIAAEQLPQARLVMLDDVHHQPTDEAPQFFVEAVQTFLSNGRVSHEE
jgi:pimeloyl-ACP methyl ester carboxylesterase